MATYKGHGKESQACSYFWWRRTTKSDGQLSIMSYYHSKIIRIRNDTSVCYFAYTVYGTFLLAPIICTLETMVLGWYYKGFDKPDLWQGLKIKNTQNFVYNTRQIKPAGAPQRISQDAVFNISEYNDETAGSTEAGNLFTSWVIIEFSRNSKQVVKMGDKE